MDFEEIYRQIAQKHGVSVQEVRDEMQKAITMAWTDAERTEEERMRQQEVISADEIPTPEDLVRHVITKIKKH